MPTVRDKLAKKTTRLASKREPLEDHPADLANYEEGQFYQIDIEKIQDNPHQPPQTL